MRLSVSAGALVRELEGEAVLLDLDSGICYGLNGVGSWIWRRVSSHGGDLPFETVVAELVAEFEVEPAVAERHLADFVEALRANRLAHVER